VVLDAEPAEALEGLTAALARPEPERRDAVSAVVARFPAFLDGWARLGELARDEVEAYACFRVGYHRGLDRLRQSGWRGSGYVRWRHETNRGFLRALRGLRDTAVALGEPEEAERCRHFLVQLDPVARWLTHDGGVSDRPDVPEIDVQELARLHEEGAYVLDVREPDEYEAGHVPGAVLVPLGEVAERQAEVPTDRPVYVVCGSGGRSARATDVLNGTGHSATNVDGGTKAWIAAGHPVTEGTTP